MLTDVFHKAEKQRNIKGIAIKLNKQGTQGNGDPLVSIPEAVVPVGCEHKMSELGFQRGIPIVILNLFQRTDERPIVEQSMSTSTTDLDCTQMNGNGLFHGNVNKGHHF